MTFGCQDSGHRGADVRPNFGWAEEEATRRATISGRYASGTTSFTGRWPMVDET
jgi:hypothetical protein